MKRTSTKRKCRHGWHFAMPGSQNPPITLYSKTRYGTKSGSFTRTPKDIKLGAPGSSLTCMDAGGCQRDAENLAKQLGHPVLRVDWTYNFVYIAEKQNAQGHPTSTVQYKHDDPDPRVFDQKGGKSKILASDTATREITIRPLTSAEIAENQNKRGHDKPKNWEKGRTKRVRPEGLKTSRVRIINTEISFGSPRE